MALPAAALCITGTLLVLATASQDRSLQVGLSPPCSITLSPEGPCERDGCPFVFNLPPMTVHLPKQLLDLERLVEELQMLKDNVDELRRICKDCAVSQSEKCTQGAEEDAHNLNNITQNWENNERNADEETEKDGKTLDKKKMEQVVAGGQKVRISERKKADRKQTERNGLVKGAADKQSRRLSNASPMQNTTNGKSDPWQVMDSKKQTEAADEDGAVKAGEIGISYGTDIWGKRDHQRNREEHVVNDKDERGGDTGSRQDKHHKASHEERREKTTQQPIASDRPVWRDKALLDTNQMETDRGSEDRPEKNSHGSSQSGRHVWPDETMESSNAARTQLSGTNSGADNYLRQGQSKISQNNGNTKDLEKEMKDEKLRRERFRQNTKLMEATDFPRGSQASVVNSAQSHGFIDLDHAVTLTSPPSFTTSHLTTAVKEGQQRQMNGKGGIKEQLGVDVRLARGHEKFEDRGETNIGQIEISVLESSGKKVDMGSVHKPAKTEGDASSTFEFSTNVYQGKQNIVEPPTQSNDDRNSTTFERSNFNETFANGAKQLSIPARKINSTTNTGRQFSRVVSQGEQKTAHRFPSQTGHATYLHTEKSNLDIPSSTISIKDSETKNSEFYQSKISKILSTNDGSHATISPVTTSSHFPSDIKQDHKATFGQSSKNNHNKIGSNTIPANVDDLTKISNPELKAEYTAATSDPILSPTHSQSHARQDLDQNHREANNQPTSPNHNRMGNKKEYSRPDIKSYMVTDVDATTSTTAGPKSKATVHRDEKEHYSPMHSNADTQFLKSSVPLTTGALEGTSSTTKSSDSQFSLDIKHHHLQTNYKEASQGNPEEKSHSAGHPSQSVQSAKSNAKEEAVSTPTVSPTALHKGHTNELKGPPSKHEHSIFNARLPEASSTQAMGEDGTSLDSTVSSSYNTMHLEKDHREIAMTTSTKSDTNKKDLEKEPGGFGASNKFTIQPTESALAEDSTISMTTHMRNSNNVDRKTLQKTLYEQPTNHNEKDKINDLETVRVSGHAEDITSSTPALRRDASFKDDIISTLTSHQTWPTTTTPSMTGNKKKTNSSKTVPYQRTKPSIGMKPEASPKVKNPKNDRKLDRSPSPDSRVKNDHRQKHPKVTPVQIPQRPHQSMKTNEPDDNVFPLEPRPPTQRPTPAASMTGLHIDEAHRPNATTMHEGTQGTHKQMRKENGPKLMHFIQKSGNTKNSSGNITQTLNRSSEVNGTTQRMDQGVKKSSKVNAKVPKVDQKTKLPAPKVKPTLGAGQKGKLQQAPKVKVPKGSKIADLRNGTKVLPGQKQPTKAVKAKTIPATKTKAPPKAKDSSPQTEAAPTPDPVKLTHSKSVHDPSRQDVMHLQTINPNSRVLSNLGPQTTHPTSLIALTTKPNKAPSAPAPSNNELNRGGLSPSSQPPQLQLRPTVRSVFRSTAAPASSHGSRAPAAKSTTPSARELRVRINQMAAFPNKSIQQHPHGRPLDTGPREPDEDAVKTERKSEIQAARDCSDHILQGHSHSGVYLVTPDPGGDPVPVLCDMAEGGGGWTVLQRRQDGSVSFNRTWAEYREGFGQLQGEFWLGNRLLHLLTRDRSMELRVELEDFEGARQHAHYQLFRVASERMRYRLTVDGYSGTAGDALRFSPQYDHNNRAFTTPDRDNDRYPSGNCGAYYSSGWWFDACMAANLNGRYYRGRYRGVRDGIYWGTWHNISTEYYPTNERLAFRSVTMMTRPSLRSGGH